MDLMKAPWITDQLTIESPVHSLGKAREGVSGVWAQAANESR